MVANRAGKISGKLFAKCSLPLSSSREIDEYHHQRFRSGASGAFVRKISKPHRKLSAEKSNSRNHGARFEEASRATSGKRTDIAFTMPDLLARTDAPEAQSRHMFEADV